MSGINTVTIVGNVGREAELRYLSSGVAKLEFSVATSYKPRQGEEVTDWHNVVQFGDSAEAVSQYITKGKAVGVEGRISYRSWEDDQGVKHYRTEIIANRITLLAGAPQQGSPAKRREAVPEVDDDDLPFE